MNLNFNTFFFSNNLASVHSDFILHHRFPQELYLQNFHLTPDSSICHTVSITRSYLSHCDKRKLITEMD
jgi:hypothetical protein